MVKTKALISFAVTAKLICDFVFSYVKSRFSHNEAHIVLVGILHSLLLHCTPSNFSSCRVLHIAGLFVLYTCVIVSQHFEAHKRFCYYGNWYLNAILLENTFVYKETEFKRIFYFLMNSVFCTLTDYYFC